VTSLFPSRLSQIEAQQETIATLPGGWDLAHAIRLGIKPFAELGANSEALSESQVDSPCSCRAIFESAPVAMLQSPHQCKLHLKAPRGFFKGGQRLEHAEISCQTRSLFRSTARNKEQSLTPRVPVRVGARPGPVPSRIGHGPHRRCASQGFVGRSLMRTTRSCRSQFRRPRSRKSLGFEVLENLVHLTASPAYVLPGLDFSFPQRPARTPRSPRPW